MLTLEEALRGESKNVEFKRELPQKSDKYMKTVVAFANSQGGMLIFGVEDGTREIIGISNDTLFQQMDAIANAIDDSCQPQIPVDIEPQTVNEKTLIVVTVPACSDRPYFLKEKGRDAGTYIRLAGTSRPAYHDRIIELEMEGHNISWDEQPCIGANVTEGEINTLCNDIISYRKKAKLPEKDVSEIQLENWKLLRRDDGVLTASNAFVLLTSDDFPDARIQCALFRGKDRGIFLDKKDCVGPLYRQIDDAVTFVLRNIRLAAEVKGLLRSETYELPVTAIREMIINAVCHRDYRDPSCVQVAIYDDRLEVTSPGGLYNGLTYEDVMQGRSRHRNRALANVFTQMGLVESWGTGIRKIRNAAKEYGLPEPSFQEFDSMFRVNLYRNTPASEVIEPKEKFGDNSEKFGDSSEKFGDSSEKLGDDIQEGRQGFADLHLNNTQIAILNLIRKDNRISASRIGETLSLSSRAIEKNIGELKSWKILIRHGSPRGGYWEIKILE